MVTRAKAAGCATILMWSICHGAGISHLLGVNLEAIHKTSVLIPLKRAARGC